jgi:hypothetical protein
LNIATGIMFRLMKNIVSEKFTNEITRNITTE